jgi:hypothetical protein
LLPELSEVIDKDINYAKKDYFIRIEEKLRVNEGNSSVEGRWEM